MKGELRAKRTTSEHTDDQAVDVASDEMSLEDRVAKLEAEDRVAKLEAELRAEIASLHDKLNAVAGRLTALHMH